MIFLAIFGLMTWECRALDQSKEGNLLSFQQLSISSTHRANSGRTPSNFIPSDDLGPLPYEKGPIIDEILIEDNAGVMTRMREYFTHWDEQEKYVENWNLESTGIYVLPTFEEKKRYLNRHVLKYFDKRLSGEIKRAEEGSTLHTVGRVQKALKPSAQAEFSPRCKLKFKARILERQAKVIFDNPIFYTYADVTFKGDIIVYGRRQIENLNLQISSKYDVNQETWSTSFDRPLTKLISARISSSQNVDHMAFSSNSNQVFQLLFQESF